MDFEIAMINILKKIGVKNVTRISGEELLWKPWKI